MEPTLSHQDLSDLELVRHFAATRDERAFSLLYARHAPAVLGLLRRLSAGAEGDVNDILQETWIRAMQKFSGFRGESQFRTWLSGIAVNCHRERRRSERLRAHDDLTEVDGVAAATAHDPADVTQCLAALAPEHRDALVLHDIEGYTHEEIAAFLGIEPGTSKSRLFRARLAFRECWNKKRGDL